MGFWNTKTKRFVTMIAMVVAGWALGVASFGFFPKVPEFLTKEYFMGASLITVSSVFLLYAAYMMFDNQLNG